MCLASRNTEGENKQPRLTPVIFSEGVGELSAVNDYAGNPFIRHLLMSVTISGTP
ncbi:hypothetical protein DPMN_040648 [Dreissena polymorpha]|uniref:Uncharacterized protein n=1 Tax=Dreissena polymorpha TaxID=45954 RepID=A0A9D4CYP9_DREPO|nr:hypothetical protein DPMN_040648 [Dreissena polymorpha]